MGGYGFGNGHFVEDHGIVTDKQGNVYVVDTRNVRIQKFNSDGDFVTKWGSQGCRDDQFLIPHDIAIDSSGNIYVSDSGNVHFLAKNMPIIWKSIVSTYDYYLHFDKIHHEILTIHAGSYWKTEISARQELR